MPTYAAADGALLHYDVIGTERGLGRAIVVLAGGAARHPSYLGDLAGLASEHQLVVPHLRGVGRSPAPTLVETGSFWQQAADIDSLREHLGVQRLIVLAHSAGTRVAIAYAAQHPDRVAGLLLLTPPAGYLVDEVSDVGALVDDRRGDPSFDAALVAFSAGPEGSTDGSFNAWQQLVAPMGYAAWTGVEQAHARLAARRTRRVLPARRLQRDRSLRPLPVGRTAEGISRCRRPAPARARDRRRRHRRFSQREAAPSVTVPEG